MDYISIVVGELEVLKQRRVAQMFLPIQLLMMASQNKCPFNLERFSDGRLIDEHGADGDSLNMILINCPYCGERDQSEFSNGGEAHVARQKL